MGCSSSQPEQVQVPAAPAARTETSGTWDDDFRLPAQKKKASRMGLEEPASLVVGSDKNPLPNRQMEHMGGAATWANQPARDTSLSPPPPRSRSNSTTNSKSPTRTNTATRPQKQTLSVGGIPVPPRTVRGVSGGTAYSGYGTEASRSSQEQENSPMPPPTARQERGVSQGSTNTTRHNKARSDDYVPPPDFQRNTTGGSTSTGVRPRPNIPHIPSNFDPHTTFRSSTANHASHPTQPLHFHPPAAIPEEDAASLDDNSSGGVNPISNTFVPPYVVPENRDNGPPLEIRTKQKPKKGISTEDRRVSGSSTSPKPAQKFSNGQAITDNGTGTPSVHRMAAEEAKLSPKNYTPPITVPLANSRRQENNRNSYDGSRPPLSMSHSLQSDRTFDDFYTIGTELGKGAFAEVFIGIEKSTQDHYAVKHIMDRNKMKWNGRDALMDEIGNMIKLRQAPNVVCLHDHFLTPSQCYMVLELLPGKELFERLIQKGTFTEGEARESCRCVLNALSYMHERRITHRDLKPENLLLVDELDIDMVKLSDFGFSKTLSFRNECRTLCGTPGYLAPEILERWPSYDVQCDMFSFGAILFLLLGGYLPFDSHGKTDVKQVFERTRKGQYHFYPQRWSTVSPAAKDLVAKCLSVNPSRRISSKDALLHQWMGDGLALPTKGISAGSFVEVFGTPRHNHQEQRRERDLLNQIDRLQELNDDFTIYLEKRQDSMMSGITGPARTVNGNGTVSTFTTQFKEESTTGKPFSTFYKKGKLLGQGGFASVYRCRHKNSGITYAVKEVDTSKQDERESAAFQEEIVVLKYLRGAPFILRLFDVFYENNITYMVLEEMKGGDVLRRICEKEVYTEREARNLCKVLFRAVNYCHKKQIAHRDIKLDNLLLQEKDNDSTIKLADFGFAKKMKQKNGRLKLLSTMCGTPHYMAPEVLNLRVNGYDFRCDMWSVGVVVFCLLGGYLPFEGSLKDLAATVIQGDYRFHEEYWGDVSPSAKRLIYSLLQTDPSSRLTAEKALQSRWIEMEDSELSVKDLSLTQSKMENLRRLTTGKQKLKNAVRAIIGANKFQAAATMSTVLRQEMADVEVEAFNESEDLDFEVHFEDVYEIGESLGEGVLSKYNVATNLIGRKQYSTKKIVRCELHPRDVAALDDEIAALKELADGSFAKHVVCLHEVYEDPDATFIVFERIHGDVLIDRLIQRKQYTEFDAKELIRNLLQGIQHCHSKQIAIRNLTLDNLILPPGSETDIVIIEFDFAKKVRYPNSLKTQCGTQEFVAPEVLENSPAYDVSCDMWTVGVILFILLGGYYPFRGKTDTEVLKNVRYGNFDFRARFWEGISEDAKMLVRDLLVVNPEDRMKAQEALETCAWIQADPQVLSKDLTSTVEEMRKELGLKFKAVVQTVRAAQLLQHQL